MTKALLVSGIVLAGMVVAWAHANDRQVEKRPLDGTWELVSGQPLPQGARDIKIISGGHFIFVAYETGNGKPLYTGGGTYVLNGNSYTEHMEFASEKIGELAGKEQAFTVKVDGDSFTQSGTLSNGKKLQEVWRRVK